MKDVGEQPHFAGLAKFVLCERFERVGSVVRGRAYPKLKSRSVVVLKPLVKKKPLFLGRERSLIFFL